MFITPALRERLHIPLAALERPARLLERTLPRICGTADADPDGELCRRAAERAL